MRSCFLRVMKPREYCEGRDRSKAAAAVTADAMPRGRMIRAPAGASIALVLDSDWKLR